MGRHLEHMVDKLVMYLIASCLFLSLFILTWIGVGDIAIVSVLGFLLCAVGFVQGSVRMDLWVLVPLILYNLFSMASSYATYGNIVDGYASTQIIYVVLYLVLAYADEKQEYILHRLCAFWAVIVAVAGLCQFIYRTMTGSGSGRLSGILGNANALGIFLVVGWFVLLDCTEDREENRWNNFLLSMEPFLLAALAMTLSMGSFLAMALGIVILFLGKKRQSSLKEMLRYAYNILAKAVLGVGVGLLLYLTGTRTDAPWFCLFLLLYLVALSVCWKKLDYFLKTYVKAAAVIALSGVLVTAVVILIRPSSYATFAERLEMMHSGLKYLTVNPFLGVGPYRWRFLDMYDGGTYYNTWHIHNALLHVGVELGMAAMILLGVIVVRFLCKKNRAALKAGFAAFFFHNMMDTSFFYLGITAMVLLAVGNPQNGGKMVRTGVMRVLFGGMAILFAYNLYYYMIA